MVDAVSEVRRHASAWIVLALLGAAGFTLVAGVAAADGGDVPTRLLGASPFAREVSIEAMSVSGAATLSLRRDGVGVATRTVDVEGARVRFDGVAVPSRAATFTVAALSSEGDVIDESAPLPVVETDFLPCPPVVGLADRAVVGSSPVVRGVQCSATTTIVALVNGAPVATQSVRPVRGPFAVQLTGLPYQASTLRVRATNVWGSSDSAPYTVWNLGVTLPRATYIVVDKSECRLYMVRNSLFVKRYSISIGTPRTPTPSGEFVITKKRRNTPPKQSGLGAYWLRLEKITSGGRLKFSGYFIHGTSWKRAIGMAASLGCVDMLDKEILKFGPTVAVGTHVLIRE